jgi:uncharacterized protein (TIGR00369 family)
MRLMTGFRELLGIEVEDADEGEARLKLNARAEHLNPAGSVHGGAIATLVDTAMGEAVATDSGDRVPATVEIKINYLEPAKPGILVATARTRRPGKRFLVLEAEVVQEETGEHVAYATGTFTTLG